MLIRNNETTVQLRSTLKTIFYVFFSNFILRLEWDQPACMDVQDQDLQGALKLFEEDIDPRNLAYVKYHPSSRNPHSAFADESYKPPRDPSSHLKQGLVIEGREKFYDSDGPHEGVQLSKPKPFYFPGGSSLSSLSPSSHSGGTSLVEELAQAVQRTKGENKTKPGKNSKGKNKNKNTNKNNPDTNNNRPIVKKSILNLEYPYNLYPSNPSTEKEDKDRKERNAKSPMSEAEEEAALVTGLLREWNSLPIDEDVELSPMLKPKIFSSFYNTPDLFRVGVEVCC